MRYRVRLHKMLFVGAYFEGRKRIFSGAFFRLLNQLSVSANGRNSVETSHRRYDVNHGIGYRA